MRKEFSVGRKVVSADLYVCGLGYYEAYLNGRRVGDHVLDPAWTNFHKRAFYVTYDVTGMIRRGGNAIGIMLGRGQYSPICTDIWGLYRSKWVGQPKAIALLAIRYSDGTTERIVTDESWRTAAVRSCTTTRATASCTTPAWSRTAGARPDFPPRGGVRLFRFPGPARCGRR